ncbi:universal stress protein [Breoghania sp. L-A4]|uniref:universal stress protein n=1 Tax=Breoghania sp. L-A4 TaxID=2304600 RepID=UPI0020BECE9C|nr:universal stress protein [Breoghania sp. L-A4]
MLVAVDPAETDFSKPALAKAAQFSNDYGAVLRLLSVMPFVQGYVSEFLPPDFDEKTLADMRKRLEDIGRGLGLPADKVSVDVRTGGVYHEVLEAAKTFHADLIVVSSHHPGFATYLIGSNAANVVRHADCSVLVVRE